MELQLTKFEDSIKKFLDNLAEEDELFAQTYKKENKNIKECCKYIYQQVEKARNGSNCVGCEDDEIYGLAIHYYDEDDIVVDGPKAKVEKVEHVPDAPKADVKPRKSRAKKAVVQDENVPDGLVIPLF